MPCRSRTAIAVLRNQGDRTFASPVSTPGNRTNAHSPSVALGDVGLDEDGDLVAAATASASCGGAQNQGDGTFAARGCTPRAPCQGPGLAGFRRRRFPGHCGGHRQQFLGSRSLEPRQWHVPACHRYTVGATASGVAAGDLDADGRADLAVANAGSGSVSILRNRGDGLLLAQTPYAVGANPVSVLFNDFDGDGAADLAVANSANVQVLRNEGDGTLEDNYRPYAVGPSPSDIAMGDFDGDEDADLVAITSNATNNASVLMNQGNGTFAGFVQLTVGGGPRAVVEGDLDGDGDVDLAFGNSNGVSVVRNQGNGTFTAHVTYDVENACNDLALGDLDGDGDADIAAATKRTGLRLSNNVWVLGNHGDGTFATDGQLSVSLLRIALEISTATRFRTWRWWRPARRASGPSGTKETEHLLCP